ncbi:hypothetical protein [Halalkalibacterium ligniniphilum]|uniref:hypothetical protein n=1 Tax=Halalkalibacterium ligniniphilum TaxID=1134413 RepID=UPI00034DB05A|nr:hypothetical protein [Halalkalibacterium ligniniphilum]
MQQQMTMNQQQQQSIMPEPPNVITTKDHLYIQDMLSWNLLASKKAHFFAQQCTDPEIKQALEQAGQMHQRHYDTIIHHLQNTSQQAMTLQ